MVKARVEEVFVVSGVPSVTFVDPVDFDRLKVALRTKGRGVIIEGPSGVGKTSAVSKALDALGMRSFFSLLTARNPNDIETIRDLMTGDAPKGAWIVDDFHRLEPELQNRLADIIKQNADLETADSKFVLIGVTNAGQSLVSFGHDLVTRIDIFRFEANPNNLVRQIPILGGPWLNATFLNVDDIVERAQGSFFIAQLLCQRLCIANGILEETDNPVEIITSVDSITDELVKTFETAFRPHVNRFCLGIRQRAEGRAPYLRLLQWLADSGGWSLNINETILVHSVDKGSVEQIVKKGYLERLLKADTDLQAFIHFDPRNNILTVEDPRFLFYLRNLHWATFARSIGFSRLEFTRPYDFALSFAGADTPVAQALYDALGEYSVTTFFANESASEIMGRPIEDVLGPIYQHDGHIIVAILGPEYPRRRWTQFEENEYRHRMTAGQVVPIFFKQGSPSFAVDGKDIAGSAIDRDLPLEPQAESIASQLNELRNVLLVREAQDR